MLELWWELHQQQRIRDAQDKATQGQREARSTAREMQDLRARVDALTLACTTMWSLLQTRFGMTDEEFGRRLNEIDLRDGKLDGRIAPEIKSCPQCQRTMSSRHARCMYCGDDHLQKRPFEGAR